MQLELNALTDVIANTIGMLVLLAVVTLVQIETRVFDIDVPLEYETERSARFYICKDDTIMHLDFAEVVNRLVPRLLTRRDEGMTPTGYYGLHARLDGEVLTLHAAETSGWDGLAELDDPEGVVRRTLDALDPKSEYAFFFVYDDRDPIRHGGSGYDIFRHAERALAARGVHYGWLPVSEGAPPRLCDDARDRRCSHLPQRALTPTDSPEEGDGG